MMQLGCDGGLCGSYHLLDTLVDAFVFPSFRWVWHLPLWRPRQARSRDCAGGDPLQ